MHYAAATRDGGHYLKILSKAGADPLAVDNVSFDVTVKGFTNSSFGNLLKLSCTETS